MRTSKVKSDKEVLSIGTLNKEGPNKDMSSKEVPTNVVYNKEERVQRQKPPSMVDGFIGKDIYIMLRSGNKLEGKLESVVQYEIIVTILHQPVIIMKHAIDYIGLVSK